MGVPLAKIDDNVTYSKLEENSIEITNLIGTFNVDGEFDRQSLAKDLPNSEYNPEKHRSMIFRSPDVVLLLSPSGKVSISGATKVEDLINGQATFMSELSNLSIDRGYSTIQVENIVAQTKLSVEDDLSIVAHNLGLDVTEYEPEQFPGLFYRPDNGSVLTIFSTGSCIINGTKTYEELLNCYHDVTEKL